MLSVTKPMKAVFTVKLTCPNIKRMATIIRRGFDLNRIFIYYKNSKNHFRDSKLMKH